MLNGNINVYVDEEGKLHFVNGNGADSVLNFSSSKTIFIGSYSLAQGSRPTTVNVANKVPNYKNLTADNFLYKVTALSELDWTSGSWGTNNYSQSYNSGTGDWSIVISETNWSTSHNFAISMYFDLYVIP